MFKVVYFQFGNPAGYVLHEVPAKKWQSIMISIGPFFLNTIVGALIALPAALSTYKVDNSGFLEYLLMYLGISIAMHAFPSRGDANSIWQVLNEKDTNPLVKIVGFPIIGLIYLGAIGSFFWLDAIYGYCVAIELPKIIISHFV